MITGKQALGSIDGTVRQQRAKIDAVEQRLDALGQRLVTLQQQQVADYRELAQYRVDDLAGDRSGQRLLGYLDDAERRIHKLLQQREKSVGALTLELEQTEQQRDQLDARRSAQADVMEALDTRVDDLEADVQQQLAADPTYLALREQATELRRIARHARDKATQSADERQRKGATYEQDPLFTYLWQRRYGRAEYQAITLVRALDDWVAGLVGYGDARANYQRLLEIPERLDEHATAKEEEAEAAYRALEQRDASALQAAGAAQLVDEQAGEQDKLDAIDQQIDALTENYEQLLARREQFTAGDDDAYQAIVKFISAEVADDPLHELRADALATPYPEDDIIIDRLMAAEDERTEIARLQRELRNVLERHREHLHELETARKQFKARRYDNPRSGFADGALVGVVLGELLNGALRSDALWDVLGQQQRPRQRRSRPDFGSGGFGRGTPWGGGNGSATRSRHRSSNGGFGGGSFKTGGGFGGERDTFRTDGGF